RGATDFSGQSGCLRVSAAPASTTRQVSSLMPALQLQAVRKAFGSTMALDGVDLVVHPGETVAIIGENGAGKSTLLNIIAGVFPPDSGTLELADKRVAYIRQELALFPHLTVAENILMGRQPSRLGFVDSARMNHRARELLAAFGVNIEPSARVREL